MTIKTNKSYAKRLKKTKSGKLLSRKSGQNHFNSKERQAAKSPKKRDIEVKMSNKDRARFLVNI